MNQRVFVPLSYPNYLVRPLPVPGTRYQVYPLSSRSPITVLQLLLCSHGHRAEKELTLDICVEIATGNQNLPPKIPACRLPPVFPTSLPHPFAVVHNAVLRTQVRAKI